VGGRLVPCLLEQGYRVRVLVRGLAERLAGRSWQADVEIASGDVMQSKGLDSVMEGVDTAYYLVHGMRWNEEIRQRRISAAQNFSLAAKSAGVRRIIYLTGLGDPEGELSEYLGSRQETGRALRSGGVPVTEFRAGIIVGSGSLFFEMVRHLTERFPIMICPKWVFLRTHPIAIHDVLQYLIAAIEVSESSGQIIEIGGADVLTFVEIMETYTRIQGLRRMIIPVPVLSPRLSSYWAHWVTPIPASIARPLINRLRYELVADKSLACKLFPEIKPVDYQTAVELALEKIESGRVESIWSDALASSNTELPPVYFTQDQGMLRERRQMLVQASPHSVFQVFSGLGGRRGWPPDNWLWLLRGAIDRLIGGVGMRRGRRHPDKLRVGEAIDFWRVEALEPNHMLRLRAEMKLPGQGWLQFETSSNQDGQTELVQTAFFAARGLFGLAYWYGIYPLHSLVFARLIAEIARQAETATTCVKASRSV